LGANLRSSGTHCLVRNRMISSWCSSNNNHIIWKDRNCKYTARNTGQGGQSQEKKTMLFCSYFVQYHYHVSEIEISEIYTGTSGFPGSPPTQAMADLICTTTPSFRLSNSRVLSQSP
jgi:hypothetical protein